MFEQSGTGGGGSGGTAADVEFVPIAGIQASNVQGAITELYNEKVAKTGDTMTGFLTLNAEPQTSLHAASKSYVDNKIVGFVKRVNGILPDGSGNVAINIVGVQTGPTLPAAPTPIQGVTDGVMFIVSGSNTSADGSAYIWSNGASAWLEISPPGLASTDARYLKLTGGTVNGPLSVLNPTAITHATNKEYVDNKVNILQGEIDAIMAGGGSGGGGGGDGPTTASEIIFVPAVGGNLVSPTVQQALVELDDKKVAKAGDTMTGPLLLSDVLPGATVQQATTKGYVDALDDTNVKRVNGIQPTNGNIAVSFGATLTGTLVARPPSAADATVYIVSGDPNPTLNGQAFIYSTNTGQWLEISPPGTASSDARYVNVGGDTMTGPLILNADPETALGAATRQYVDAAVQTNGGNATNILMGAGSSANVAVPIASSANVWNGIDQINKFLARLVPSAPAAFPTGPALDIVGAVDVRMCAAVPNNTGLNAVAAGTTVQTLRTSTYTTNSVSGGPGDSGTVSVIRNGAAAGSKVLTTGNDTGNVGDLRITANPSADAFHSTITASATGTVSSGWNTVRIDHTDADNTNTTQWYYDTSAPGTPVVTQTSFAPSGATSLTYSSTVPHFTSSQQFTAAFTVNRLSGHTYPVSDTFVTGSTGGSFSAPAGVTYAGAGITTPLTANAYSASTVSVSTTTNIASGSGVSAVGPTISVTNGYNTGTLAFTAGNILRMDGSSGVVETAIPVSAGTGTGNGFRILNPGSTDTPVFTGTEAAFNSQSSTLQVSDATVVGGVLKHDVTNYSTGYLPVGPNLSIGRSGSQYFTFKFVRTTVSKFDINWTGSIAGMWVAMPGSPIVTANNNWLDLSVAYPGAPAIPGTGSGGNGSNGAAVGGVATLNATGSHKVTATFGTVNSSSTATNEIYVRIELTAGQSVTALSITPASN